MSKSYCVFCEENPATSSSNICTECGHIVEIEGLQSRIKELEARLKRSSMADAPRDGTKILLELPDGSFESGEWVERVEDQPDTMGHDAGFCSDGCSTFPGRSFGNPVYFSEQVSKPVSWGPLPQSIFSQEGDK